MQGRALAHYEILRPLGCGDMGKVRVATEYGR